GQGLIEYLHRVAPCDHNARGQIHRVVQAFDRSHSLAFQDNVVSHRLHAEHANVVLHEHWQDSLFEAVIVCVHYVKRHLNCIELKVVLCSGGQHFQMDVWTLVPCESDKTDLACLLGFQHGFHRAAFGKNAIRIGVANHFVKLEKIDPVGLKAAEGLVDLARRGSVSTSIDLGH